ncbi:MAG: L-aspartate oxidase [Gammaproteobacteria bacterium]|nr:L-aspartate oxidase [Gammaproteobacteria bacterium]
MKRQHTADVLIVGAGAAGLAAALRIADRARVLVLSKDGIEGGSTNRAQGGIAAVMHPRDSVARHIRDTIQAGAGLCDPEIVQFVVERGPDAIRRLLDYGLTLDREGPDFHLTREGGHTERRVLHVADRTGQAIETTLVERALAHPDIELLTDRLAIDVITAEKFGLAPNRVLGAYVYNRSTESVELIRTPHVVLATGGASKVYLYTSNPDGATGDGIAMAWRAGCRVGNMEFNQFHPTCLYHPDARSFLISEAVRGEGGRLLLPNGEPFMDRFDPRGELASRDIVARAIDHEIKRLGVDCVFLDISHRPADFIESHFPTIRARLLSVGIDMTREPIPVVPAAHYTCGGVVVDRFGATDVEGLYAIGETACTGLHGANRLASNSLLECMVLAESAGERIVESIASEPPSAPDLAAWDESRVTDSDEDVVLAHNWLELRRFMWDYVGIVRTDKRLERAWRRIELLKQEVHDYYANHRVSPDLIELRNLIHVAELMVRCACSRRESRGLHYTLDYPATAARAVPSVLYPTVDPLDFLQPPARAARRSRAKS